MLFTIISVTEISLKMKRAFVETVSITSVKKIASNVEMTYLDVRTTKRVQKKLSQQ